VCDIRIFLEHGMMGGLDLSFAACLDERAKLVLYSLLNRKNLDHVVYSQLILRLTRIIDVCSGLWNELSCRWR
jgi:hypothetical protein